MSGVAFGALAVATAVFALGTAPLVAGRSLPRVAVRHPDAQALEDAGWHAGLRRWALIEGAAVLIAGAVCLAYGLPLIAAAVGAVAPSVWIRLRAEAARERSQRAVGGIVAAAEAALRSGLSLPDALRRAADGSPDAAAVLPIHSVLVAFDLGAGLDEALSAAADRAHDARARLALGTLALGIGQRLPRERLADLLGAVGERLTFEDRLGDEVHARAAGARQQQRLLAAIVPGLALYLAATMPMLSATLSSDLGRYVLVPVALALELAGIVLSRRIVGGALR